ncbi:unnamed protein product [Mytilus coruscus]|uniref:Uncharacterized protein n=1 Tax=Mytilus coruscus TaxID=42192 RepID=A0A6J8DK21_MYTCO|nr:unnamed protein product [Mytilus coruscus]
MKKFFIFCLLCFAIGNIDGVPLSDFYPFGNETSDRRAPTNDDGSTEPIPVSSLFPLFNHQHDSLIAAWMFITTWNNVAFFGADEVGKQKRCTFQCVLVTNGRHSFTIFLYNKIEWTTGTASNGNSSSGLGGTPAQVGFDAGDGLNFYAIEASRKASVINVTRMSNIDHPGKFIFRVDTTQITNGGCNVEGTLTITPREATMLGGTQLIISGPCFNQTKSMTLVMSNGEEAPCRKYNEFSVSCISPQVYRTGKEMVSLHLIQGNNQTMTFHGVLTIDEDRRLPAINTDDVEPCPCTLEVASLDTTRFSIDPICHKQEGSRYECSNQQFAQVCFKQNIASSHGYDHQCCYDEVGVLMNPDGYYGSGYVNRYHYHGGGDDNVPFLSNFVYDTLLYQHCCIYTSQDMLEVNSNFESCASFYTRRPPNSCLNYIPPRPASSVTSFVVQPYPEAEIIEVQVNQIRGIDVLVNGTLLDFDSAFSNVISAEGATIEKILDNPPTVVTNFYTEGLSIQTSCNLNVLNLLIFISPDRHNGNLTGLFGDNDGIKGNDLASNNNDLINANASASDIHHTFGLSWRIKESESLFTYERGKTNASYQNENFIPIFEIPENVSTRITDMCGSNSECIYDYLVTNDEQFGQISADLSDSFDDILGLTAPVDTCGFPPNTSNGAWYANGYTEGSIAFLNCTNGYYPVNVNLECLSTGNWSSVNISCIPFPDCGGPSPVANGLWVPNEGSNGRRATLRCKNGFYGDEIEIPCTDNGTWTEYEGSCLAAQTLSSTSDSNSKMSTASVTMTSSNFEDTTKPKTSDEIVQPSSKVYTSIRTTRQASTVMPTTQISSRQTLSSIQSSISVSSTSDSNSKMSTASVLMTSSNLEDTTKTKTSDEIGQSSSKVYTSIRTSRQASTVMPTTQIFSRQTLSSMQSSTTQSAQTTRPGTSTPTTAAKTSTIHNQQEISQTSESFPLQTSSNMPHSQFVSVKSTSSIDIKSTQGSIVGNEQISEAIAGSTTRKLSSTLKSSDTNESTGTGNFTIAISVTISVFCLAIVVTVVAVAMVKISKQRKGGLNRYEIRKSYEEDRSSTNSDPSSLYNFQIKRPLFGQEWSHQQPNHLH